MRLSEVELEQGKDEKREKKLGQVVEWRHFSKSSRRDGYIQCMTEAFKEKRFYLIPKPLGSSVQLYKDDKVLSRGIHHAIK